MNSGKNNVGDVAEYAILRTASHELTHFIENNSKESYAALKAFIVDELARKGLDFDALVQRKQDRSNVKLTREEAMAEVIADGCEMMLKDSEAITRLAQEDGSLFHKVKGFIDNFLRKIRAAFSGVEAQSIEARSLTAMREGARQYAEELQALWDNALMEAAKAHRSAGVTVETSESVQRSEREKKNPYSYEELIKKEPIHLIEVDTSANITRDEAVRMGMENVRKYADRTDRNDTPMMPVGDLNKYVTVGVKALHHGLDRRERINSAVTAKIGDILSNSILVNEANPKREKHSNTYILLGAARDADGRIIYVRSTINQSTMQLEDVTSLYAVNAKKEASRVITTNGRLTRGVPSGFEISIVDFLDGVKDYFSDVLSADVIKKFGMERKPTEITGNLRYSLREYSEHQKENWKGSKLIHIYESDEQLLDFVDRALKDRSFKGKMYYGQVSEELAKAIYAETGVETEGLNLALYSDEVVKIIRDHGNERTEVPRGQVPITEKSFVEIKDVVENPDEIRLSEKLYEGHKVIEFVKNIKGRTTVVTYVVSSKHDLHVQTMYKGKEKESLAPGKDAKASLNAPMRADTSMTSRGTALNDSISETGTKNNPFAQNSMREDTTALREYMSGLTAKDMRTETEREMLRRYQETLAAYRQALQGVEDAKSGGEEKQQEAGKALRKAERALNRMEKDGGIAQLMKQSQRVLNKYLLGKTREQQKRRARHRHAAH